MSAWIVSKAHVDVIVHALGVREMFPEGMNPDAVGAMVWQECHNSVNYRYSENTPRPDYGYAVPPVTWTPDQLLHHLECYDYQTCEHPTYEESQAYRLVTGLRDVLKAAGADSDNAPDGTPWGVPMCGGVHADYRPCESCAAVLVGVES